ncbi:MAG TPA: hypothetical protein VF011_01885 [Terriglobales bacterium]
MPVRAAAARAAAGPGAGVPRPFAVPQPLPGPLPVPYPDGTLLKGQMMGLAATPVEMIQGHERRPFPDTQTFNYMGLDANSVQTIPIIAFLSIPAGPPFPSRTDWTVLQGSGPAIYLMNNGQRHLIPDPPTFNALGLTSDAVESVADADLNSIPLGTPIPEGGVGYVHPAFPITASQDDNFAGTGGRMHTDASIYSSGLMNAVTHTWEVTDLRGFKGAVAVAVFDENRTTLWVSATQRFGVDGRWIGTSDRTDNWSETVPAEFVPKVRYIAILQHWDPNLVEDIEHWLQGINDIAQQLGTALKAIELVASLL